MASSILRTLLVIGCSLSFAGEKPKWLAESCPEPLPEGIEVSQWSTVLRVFTKITNRSGKTLVYSGYSAENPMWYYQALEEGKWTAPSTFWCGTGLQHFELRNGESVEFELARSAFRGGRRLVLFRVLDSHAGDLIAIAEDSEAAVVP